MKCIKIIFIFAFTIVWIKALPQKVDLSQVWPAKWIMPKDGSAKAYSVHHFRKSFDLAIVPDTLIIHTSGDNRYQLFVNEQLVTWGPLRGDLRHWYYESTDIVPYLKTGKNVIAAVVLNYGSHPPDAQLSVQTGFLLAADDKKFDYLNSNATWKAMYNPAYSPSMVTKDQVNGYYGGGSREIVDGNHYLWGWQDISFDDSEWSAASIIENAYAKGCKWASRWKLTPRILTHEKLTDERLKSVRIIEGVEIPESFPVEPVSFTIPPKTTGRFVLDNSVLTTAYPIMKVSGGKNAKIKFTYVEAPYIGDSKMKKKGNRNVVDGKNFTGYCDQFIADGGKNRVYKPLWWRTYRYIEVSFETAGEPLVIHDISAIHSSYPFEQQAKFRISGNAIEQELIDKMFEIGHRTILANAHEHFTDCPYYEESQFEGDTRVESLVSYYNYGDPELGRNAIDQFSWSINDEGFLSARYPTNSLYYIPNFSIYWIGMLYDYMMLHDDPEFIKSKIPVMRMILDYFHRHERENGTLMKLDYHQFVDWSFKAGEPPFDDNGYSAIVDLHYLLALQWAKRIEREFGEPHFFQLYSEKVEALSKNIRELYWDDELDLFTDIPNDKDHLSQHTNCLAILTGIIEGNEAQQVMEKVLTNHNMTKATLYWQFYLFEALEKSGMGDTYLNHLGTWEEVLKLGVTTWPETGPESRSECHGWGSSPNYHFYKIVGGITSDTPGFKKIRIAPKPGSAETLEAEVPHPQGWIRIKLSIDKSGIDGEVEIPPGTEGYFIWKGHQIALKPGKQTIKL